MPSGSFGDLKCWMLAKLAWNPDRDLDELIGTFCRGHYGKAGDKIAFEVSAPKSLEL